MQQTRSNTIEMIWNTNELFWIETTISHILFSTLIEQVVPTEATAGYDQKQGQSINVMKSHLCVSVTCSCCTSLDGAPEECLGMRARVTPSSEASGLLLQTSPMSFLHQAQHTAPRAKRPA